MKRPARRLTVSVLCMIATVTTVAFAGLAQEILIPGNGVISPRVVRDVKPEYTPEARQRGIQGRVELTAVVNDDGTVGEVKVVRSLDDKFGLDDQAVTAMRKWQFTPGTKDGKPVAVRVTVEMTFTLT